MAIGQALLTRPPKPKIAIQQQKQYQPLQGQETKQTNKTIVLQEQSLKFEQSLELVQTLLGASIGCLSFLRGLLPEECFVEKRYGGKSSAAISYRSFTSDLEDEAFKKTQSSSGTRVKRLRRGYSGEADQLLDWLEIGIFDALKMGYLKAVQLAIYIDKEHPDIIVESYTFSFSYRDKGDGASTISLRVTDINGHGVTVEDANKNLQLMMRRLINLPPLPDQRWLTIRLHYLDHTPSDYDPPSFVRVTEKSPVLKFHENETKEVEKLDVGGLNAGFHAVSLKISSTNDTDSQERPRRRRGSRFVHADVDIEALQFTTDGSQPSARTRTDSKMGLLPGPATSERAKPQAPAKSVDNHSISHNPAIDEIPNRRITEITRRDIQEKMFLRGMLRQATRGSDVISTQPLSVPRTTADGSQITPLSSDSLLITIPDSQVLGTSQRPTSAGHNSVPELMPTNSSLPQQQTGKVPNTIPQRQSPRKKNSGNQDIPTLSKNPPAQATNAIESVDKNMAKLRLSKAKTTELKKKGKHSNKGGSGRTIGKSTGAAKGAEDHINCECGDEAFEEDVICCDNCDEWQHIDCYGFASAKDTRIPDYHVCYSCLLGKNEGKLLEEMRNMALFRRALKTIWRQGNFPPSNKMFANKIGCDLPTALQITRRLENEGFIAYDAVKAKIRRKKVYEVVKTDDTQQRMEAEYFDPLKKISHHFENPTSPNIIRGSLLNDTPLARLLPNTILGSPTDTIVADSQPEEVGNVNKETIVASQPEYSALMADVDIESTADEEDIPTQKTTRDNTDRRESAMDHFRHSKRLSTTSLGHRNPVAKQRLPFEIAESPEPMEIDAVEELQLLGDTLGQIAGAGPSRPRINIGGVMQDIFVGEELGDRRF